MTFALLADEMGLGKTAQAILAADGIGAKTILVLGPAVSRFTWEREFGLWSRLDRPVHVVTSKRGNPLTPAPITICSYDLAADPKVNAWLRSVRWDVVILDESHFLKEPDAKRTAAVFGESGIARSCGRVWALSGTPAPNHAGELWLLLHVFGVYPGNYGEFIAAFCHTTWDGYRDRIVGTRTDAIPALRDLLKPIMLRRKKEDVLKELPPIVYGNMVEVEPGAVDMELCYPQYFVHGGGGLAEIKSKIEAERAVFSAVIGQVNANPNHRDTDSARVALLASLKDSVSSYRRYVGLQKVEKVAELVSNELEANAYDKIVIFAIHKDVIEGLRQRLSKFHPVTIYGGTDPATREKNIRKFQETQKCRVFIGNVIAAGTNITLTAAHNVLMVESDWVPGNNAQAIMRCHRIGQTKPVIVRFVSLRNEPNEYRVQRVLRRKTRELTAIFDA